MAQVVRTALGIVRARIFDVTVLTVGLAVPVAILSWLGTVGTDQHGSAATTAAGLASFVVGPLPGAALTVVFLGALAGSRATPFGAVKRAIVALPILIAVSLILFVVLLALFLPATLFVSPIGTAAPTVGLYIAIVASSPLELFLPVVMQERAGPIGALRRSWSISRVDLPLVALFIGGLSVAWAVIQLGVSWLVPPAGDATKAVILVISPAVGAALRAVLYVRLNPGDPVVEESKPTAMEEPREWDTWPELDEPVRPVKRARSIKRIRPVGGGRPRPGAR
jgi:hypothetical protein